MGLMAPGTDNLLRASCVYTCVCVRMCVCIYIYCIYLYMCMYTYQMCVCVGVDTYICEYMYIYQMADGCMGHRQFAQCLVCVYMCVFVFLRVCVFAYIYIVNICLCVYICTRYVCARV